MKMFTSVICALIITLRYLSQFPGILPKFAIFSFLRFLIKNLNKITKRGKTGK